MSKTFHKCVQVLKIYAYIELSPIISARIFRNLDDLMELLAQYISLTPSGHPLAPTS